MKSSLWTGGKGQSSHPNLKAPIIQWACHIFTYPLTKTNHYQPPALVPGVTDMRMLISTFTLRPERSGSTLPLGGRPKEETEYVFKIFLCA